MGMFDTVNFEKPIKCNKCGSEITSTQTKEFECLFRSFHVGDCVSHAEDIRILKEELFCRTESCIHAIHRQYIYLAIKHGILLGVAETLGDAEKLIAEQNYEKLVLMYFDQYRKRCEVEHENSRLTIFLMDAEGWFSDESSRNSPFRFTENKQILEGSKDLADALQKFLKQKKEEEA